MGLWVIKQSFNVYLGGTAEKGDLRVLHSIPLNIGVPPFQGLEVFIWMAPGVRS